MSTKKLSPGQLKKFRSDVAKLKSKGVVGKRVDARSQKPTRYMLSQVKKNADVLEGKAKVIHTPKVKDAAKYKDKFRVKGKAIVVPVNQGETVRYSKKTGEISATSTNKKGKKVTRNFSPEGASRTRAPRKGKGMVYAIDLGNSQLKFDTWGDMVLFMEPYEEKARNPYKNWENYVYSVEYDGDE